MRTFCFLGKDTRLLFGYDAAKISLSLLYIRETAEDEPRENPRQQLQHYITYLGLICLLWVDTADPCWMQGWAAPWAIISCFLFPVFLLWLPALFCFYGFCMLGVFLFCSFLWTHTPIFLHYILLLPPITADDD
jgi:hypothetical protein